MHGIWAPVRRLRGTGFSGFFEGARRRLAVIPQTLSVVLPLLLALLLCPCCSCDSLRDRRLWRSSPHQSALDSASRFRIIFLHYLPPLLLLGVFKFFFRGRPRTAFFFGSWKKSEM
jgi:hypothetical protein